MPEDGFDTQARFKDTHRHSADVFCSGVKLQSVGSQRTKGKKNLMIATVHDHLQLALRAGYKPLLSADNDYLVLRRLAHEAEWPTKSEVKKIEAGFAASGSSYGGKMDFAAINRHCDGRMMEKISWYNVLRKLNFPFDQYGD